MIIKWNENLKKAPQGGPILLKVNHGLFSGGWQWHKALRVRDKFFNADTHDEIKDPSGWATIKL